MSATKPAQPKARKPQSRGQFVKKLEDAYVQTRKESVKAMKAYVDRLEKSRAK